MVRHREKGEKRCPACPHPMVYPIHVIGPVERYNDETGQLILDPENVGVFCTRCDDGGPCFTE